MRRLITIVFLITPTLTLHAQSFTPVNVLIPTFQSPKEKSDIGRRTAAILGLQIWRTYSTPTPARSSFDNANITYHSQSRPTTYAEVEVLARTQPKNPHLVLWGRASQYGSGIVVESNLLIRKAKSSSLGTDIWRITIPTSKNSYIISVDIPEWQYEFAPIVLDPSLVLKLDNRSLSNIYQLKSTSSNVIGTLGNSSIQAINHDGDWSWVRLVNTNEVGWLYLPSLSKNPSEVVNFCGGIIRILRKDWPGAVSIFQEVLKTSDPPTNIKVDSYLYMAIAYDRMNEQAKSFSMVGEAYRLNPYSKTTSRYLYMSYLSQLSRVLTQGTKSEEAKKLIQSTQDLLEKNRVLFADDDVWIMQVKQVVTDLTQDVGNISARRARFVRRTRLLSSSNQRLQWFNI